MRAGRELDALVAEKVMGETLKPHRDMAMVAVGRSKISCTGPTFYLNNGREIPMPNGDTLRRPEGSRDWNDRYYLHVAEVLGDEIAVEVEAYRVEPKPYSTDIATAWRIVEKMCEIGRHFLLMATHESELVIASFYLGPYDRSDLSATEQFPDAPMAICRAALRAVGVELQ